MRAAAGSDRWRGAARVGGAPELPGTLDVGYGLAPGLLGEGLGSRCVDAILEFASTAFGVRRFRLFILDWNLRSTTEAARAGFVRDTTVETDDGTFLVMVAIA